MSPRDPSVKAGQKTGMSFYPEKPQHTLNLSALNLGLSLIGEKNINLAHYLSYHCLPECDFKEGRGLWHQAIEKKFVDAYGDDDEGHRWDDEREDLVKWFRIFMRQRLQRAALERERDAAIQRERVSLLLLHEILENTDETEVSS